MKKMWLAGLLAGAMCLLASCATVSSEGSPDGKMTEMTVSDWEALPGTQVDFVDPNPLPLKPGGSYPYSYAKVVETTQDYLVVEPLTLDDEAKQEPSWGETLLQKSKTYIVPRAIMGGSVLKQGNAPVGSIVEVGFNDLAVVEGTEYGQSPVMRIVFYVHPVEN